MKRPAISLHARLAWVLVAMLLVVWASLWLGSQHEVKNAAISDIDARLQRIAVTVAAVTPGVDQGRSPAGATVFKRAARSQSGPPPVGFGRACRTRTRVRGLQRRWRGRYRKPGLPECLVVDGPGYSNQQLDGRRWRVFSQHMNNAGLTVQVALDTVVTAARTSQLGYRFQTPLLWLLPVLALVALVTLWQGLAPVRQLRRRLAGLDAARPAPTGLADTRLPREFVGLVRVLDGLMTRLARVLERQRIFAAAAGHELRTPLAGCRSQIDRLRRATHGDQRAAALAHIDERIAYMGHLATQLQRLARASHLPLENEPIELAPMIRGCVVRRHGEADARGVALEVTALDETARITGETSLTDSLIDNLLRNAIDVTPGGGIVRLALWQTAAQVMVRISDGGPGTETENRSLFEPFVCTPGHADSTGLGLAIVAAVAEAQRADVVFERDNDNAHSVVVRWPRGDEHVSGAAAGDLS